MSLSYKDAGVDLDKYAQAMGMLPALVKKTQTPRVMPLSGGFAGLFQLQGDGHSYRDPVLVSGTDGVGTKLIVAKMAGRYDTVGIDLVAMCVNDCICLGAEPLFFLDYLALDKDDPEKVAALVKGVADGCVDAGASLIGGETAILPDMYQPGDYDMAGFCVGVVEKNRMIDGKNIKPGQVILGVASSGIHSNGYSLARKAIFDVGQLTYDSVVPELNKTVADILLTPTRIYAKTTQAILKDESIAPHISGIAHITGGGLAENIGRIMPDGVRTIVDRSKWSVPAVFNWMQQLGNIDREEMFRVFNMGIGLAVVVDADVVDKTIDAIAPAGFVTQVIGEVVAGETGGEYRN